MQSGGERWGSECLRGLPNDRRYLVGVSGGRDSVVLLHWLIERGYRRLIVCHFEHGLRGRAGKADARFVARLAETHGLPFESGAADIREIAREKKQSIETAARNERRAFFARVARRRRCGTIFLGHHADDQVETFLLNLFRGAAGRGLGAMRSRSQHGALEIVRPLLGVWRSEIDDYVAEHRLKFREDATNEELDARRNRMRHKIIPLAGKAARAKDSHHDLARRHRPGRRGGFPRNPYAVFPNDKRGTAGRGAAPAGAGSAAARHSPMAHDARSVGSWLCRGRGGEGPSHEGRAGEGEPEPRPARPPPRGEDLPRLAHAKERSLFVIPSREDGEGPHTRRAASAT